MEGIGFIVLRFYEDNILLKLITVEKKLQFFDLLVDKISIFCEMVFFFKVFEFELVVCPKVDLD